MTNMSGACDISDFDGNTNLLGSDYENVFISGFDVIKLSTEDKDIDFISLMSENMTPTAIVIG